MLHLLGSMKHSKRRPSNLENSLEETELFSCHFCKGNLHRKHKDFVNSRLEYQISLALLTEKVKANSHVRTCACLYKLATMDIEEGGFAEAAYVTDFVAPWRIDQLTTTPFCSDRLQSALAICNKQKKNLGDRARVLNKLSEALSNVPGQEVEARKKGQTALQLYRDLAAPGSSVDVPKEQDYDALVCGLHR